VKTATARALCTISHRRWHQDCCLETRVYISYFADLGESALLLFLATVPDEDAQYRYCLISRFERKSGKLYPHFIVLDKRTRKVLEVSLDY